MKLDSIKGLEQVVAHGMAKIEEALRTVSIREQRRLIESAFSSFDVAHEKGVPKSYIQSVVNQKGIDIDPDRLGFFVYRIEPDYTIWN